jgi:flagellar motor switch protein FliM
MAKKLSKDECDALLSIFNGKKNSFDSVLKEKTNNQGAIISSVKKNATLIELVPVFQFVFENLCQNGQKKISIEFKSTIYLKTFGTHIVKFGEYKKSLEKDSLTFIFNAKEIHCSVLIHVKDELASSLVNKSLGSSKSNQHSLGHAHSKIDEAIILKHILILAKELELSINSAFDKINLNYLRIENRPQLLSIIHPDDEVLLALIEISSELISGEFHVVIPALGVKGLQGKKG